MRFLIRQRLQPTKDYLVLSDSNIFKLTVGIFLLAVVLVNVSDINRKGSASTISRDIIPPMEMPTRWTRSCQPTWSSNSNASCAIWDVLVYWVRMLLFPFSGNFFLRVKSNGGIWENNMNIFTLISFFYIYSTYQNVLRLDYQKQAHCIVLFLLGILSSKDVA